MRIAILLSIFNPDPSRLKIQLASIAAQTSINWALFVRVDGDTSPQVESLLNEYSQQYPRFIEWDKEAPGRIGRHASLNILGLRALKLGFKRFVVAEQDGVWLESFIARTEKAITLGLESQMYPKLVAFDFVHSKPDGLTVDPGYVATNLPELHVQAPVLIKNILLKNLAPNPVFAFNLAAAQKIFPIPDQTISAAWWSATVVLASRGSVQNLKPVLTVSQDATQFKQNIIDTVRFTSEMHCTHLLSLISNAGKIAGEQRHQFETLAKLVYEFVRRSKDDKGLALIAKKLEIELPKRQKIRIWGLPRALNFSNKKSIGT